MITFSTDGNLKREGRGSENQNLDYVICTWLAPWQIQVLQISREFQLFPHLNVKVWQPKSQIFLSYCPEQMRDNTVIIINNELKLAAFDYFWNQDFWIADRLDSCVYHLTQITKFRSHTTEIPSLSVDRPASRSSIMI